MCYLRFITALWFFVFTASLYAALPAPAPEPRTVAPLPSLAPMLKRTTPAVVNISTKGTVQISDNPLLNDPIFRDFFDIPQAPRERQIQSLGSGVIIDAGKGYVITNHHVVAHAEQISIALTDGRHFDAKLIGSDPDTDIAILQIKATDLVALPLADSEQLQVGDFVVAIGNPFGLGQTVTSGIVSALGRTNLNIERYENFIQTDASINPGNSGGALVDLHGNLVGINAAIIGPSGGNVGIGFAIPTNMVKALLNQLIQYGTVKRGVLGVIIQDLTPELTNAFKAEGIQRGAVVSEVKSGSTAAKAGFKVGDIVLSMNGKPIASSGILRNAIGALPLGTSVTLEVFRNGERKIISATLTEGTLQTTMLTGKEIHQALTGATFSNFKENNEKSVIISQVSPGSPAWRTGFKKGDIIVSANRMDVANLQDLKKAIKSSNRQLLLNIRRGDAAFYIVIQ